MTAVSALSKLAELRTKTDRDLAGIIGNLLELGIRFASAGLDAAGPLHEKAESIHTNASILLPRLEDVTERRRLELKLERLREFLDRPDKLQAASASAF